MNFPQTKGCRPPPRKGHHISTGNGPNESDKTVQVPPLEWRNNENDSKGNSAGEGFLFEKNTHTQPEVEVFLIFFSFDKAGRPQQLPPSFCLEDGWKLEG